MNNTPTGGRPSKNERREQAREQARLAREAQRKKDRRNRILLQSGIIVGVLAVVAVIALVIVSSVRPPGPGPRNMASDGILLQSDGNGGVEAAATPALEPGETPAPNPTPTAGDVLQIQTYVDYMCPFCGQFEATNAGYLRTLVESGAATLELFPISFLDRNSMGTEYSTRAMNAVGCLADQQPDSVLRFHELLYENQPPEPSEGLTNDQLVGYAQEAGADSAAVETCIREQTFKNWTEAATDHAMGVVGVQGTPTVIVNGQVYTGTINGQQYNGSLTDQATFRQFIAAQQGVQFVEQSQETPAPTPTPTPSS